MTLNFVLGTAAELIKLNPLITRARARGWPTRVFATGQSGNNLREQARDFGIADEVVTWLVPGRDLRTSRSALNWFARAMVATPPPSLRGELALVHGDTLSTLSGAWLARRAGARVVHVEAGLRSNRLWNPFPEEVTRRLVSRLAHVHVAPDEPALRNLRAAGVRGTAFSSGGNTLADAVRDGARAGGSGAYALANLHRFENLNSPRRWQAIERTVLTAARTHPLIFIAHPQTRARLERGTGTLARWRDAGVEVRDRVSFSEFMTLLRGARYLISDGGSNQEECSYLGIPCLLLRLETERREGLGENCVLSKFDDEVITGFLKDPERFRTSPALPATSPSELILDRLAADGR